MLSQVKSLIVRYEGVETYISTSIRAVTAYIWLFSSVVALVVYLSKSQFQEVPHHDKNVPRPASVGKA